MAVQLIWKETDLIKRQSSNTARSFLFNLNTLWSTTNSNQKKGGSSDQKKEEVVSPHQEAQVEYRVGQSTTGEPLDFMQHYYILILKDIYRHPHQR